MKTRLAVRWRLTLWFAALFAILLLAIGGTLFVGLRERLYAGFDDQLLGQAAVTTASIRITGSTPALSLPTEDPREGEYFIRLVDSAGQVKADNGEAMGGVPFEARVIEAALGGATTLSSWSAGEDEALRIATVPVRTAGEDGPVIGALQVGLDRGDLDLVLNQVIAVLLIVAPLALVLAGSAGYWLAGRALAPVVTITNLASSIDARDLNARLNLDLPDDEIGALARTFDAMLDRIEQAFEQQRRFTADAAHELRTPLSLMRTRIDLALARPRSVTEHEVSLEGLDRDLARLTGLATTLLALARAEADELPLNRQPFDGASVVRSVFEQYDSIAHANGIALQQAATAAPLVADLDLLVQVLVNLVENAVAHTAAGGAIAIGCAPDGNRVRFWVTDTGVGIAPEHHERVFDRFYRVDAGRTRARGGAGLGLAICRTIVEAHGGTIGLTSQPGTGTRVDVTFPRQTAGATRTSIPRIR